MQTCQLTFSFICLCNYASRLLHKSAGVTFAFICQLRELTGKILFERTEAETTEIPSIEIMSRFLLVRVSLASARKPFLRYVCLRRCKLTATCTRSTRVLYALRIVLAEEGREGRGNGKGGVGREEGKTQRLKSRTARRQPVHAIDRPSFIGMCIAILPQFCRGPFGAPFSAARQSGIRYRAPITPFIFAVVFSFSIFPARFNRQAPASYSTSSFSRRADF